jgi:hypothetical protein
VTGFGRPDYSQVDPSKLAGLVDHDFRAPDMIGTVEGWRAWNVLRQPPLYGNPPRLESASWAFYWTPRVKARAVCSKGCADEHVPGESCTCGFYSAKTLDDLREMSYPNYDEEGERVCVVGCLANWGKVIEGTQGWRAEYAYPSMIYVPFEAWKLADPISRAYGVPVRLLNLLDPTAQPGDYRRELRPKDPTDMTDMTEGD